MNPRVMLLVTGLEPGGAEAQVVRLAIQLRSRGWDTVVTSLLEPKALTRELTQAGVPGFSLDMQPERTNWRGLARFVALLRRFRPQVLHTHLFHANVLARLARLVSPVPVLISTLHSAAESGRESSGIRARDWAYRLTDPMADAVVAVSQAAAERHHAAGAAQRRKLRVIPNSVDTSVFRPDACRRARTRTALALDDRFVWLAAGRWMWKKDFATLLRAFAEHRGAVLLLAGEGPQETHLRALARELSVEVRFLGRRDDMPGLMNAADAFVLSSIVEGLPLVLLEAAASGLPCVTTDAGGAREAVTSETGFVVPPGDAEALGAAIERLTALPPDARARMGAAARETAVARFDIGVVAAQWERLYRELLSWT